MYLTNTAHCLIACLIVVQFAPACYVNAQDSTSRPWSPDAELVEQFSARKNHPFNYRESDVPEYQLPPVLGEHSEKLTANQWPERRAELLDLFRQHVYGRRPKFDEIDGYKVEYQVDPSEPIDPTGGKAKGEKVVCEIYRGGQKHAFPFFLYVPSQQIDRPLPLIVLINNREFPNPAEMLDSPAEFWPLDLLVEAGFATAVFHTSDVDPDRADGYQEGVRGFLANGQPRGSDGWGSLSAWGWAASKVLDYADSKLKLDPQRIAVVGHSRGGKTALWATAEDSRFTIAYSNESGCGGAALSRRRFGETVARITSSFPHWFSENFSTYSGKEDGLPVDQHQLIALIAPRATYVASASGDLWADPRGEYLSLVHAAPAYQLLGCDSITDPEMPALGEQRFVGKTGYHIRPGEHNLTRADWTNFINFVQTLD